MKKLPVNIRAIARGQTPAFAGVAVAVCLLLSGCIAPSAENNKQFTQYVKEQYPIGSDEKILMHDFAVLHYYLRTKNASTLDGKIDWKRLTSGAHFPMEKPCGRTRDILWRADKNGAIIEMKVSASVNHSCVSWP